LVISSTRIANFSRFNFLEIVLENDFESSSSLVLAALTPAEGASPAAFLICERVGGHHDLSFARRARSAAFTADDHAQIISCRAWRGHGA
jgi:hypothetical protein